MKNADFRIYAYVLISSILIFPFFIGMLLGIFLTSSVDSKYLTVLVGAFAGVLAFAGVVYSKEKERSLKQQEIEHEKIKDRKNLLIQKTEELLDLLSTCFISIYHQNISTTSMSDKSEFFIKINQIEFIHKTYSIGDPSIFRKLLSHSLGIDILEQDRLIDAYDDFRDSIMKQTKEKLLP